MSTHCLLLRVWFHEPRYHGEALPASSMADWPPSPMRLFQALVAGAAQGNQLEEADRLALLWLEALPPPIIVAPGVSRQRRLENFVPNNDAGKHKDPSAHPRSAKKQRALIFDEHVPLTYAWQGVANCDEARQVCVLAEHLHHFGRYIDPAWCEALLPDVEQGAALLRLLAGRHHHPGAVGGRLLDVPVIGTLRHLQDRFMAAQRRFRRLGGKTSFQQVASPLSRQEAYDAPAQRQLYDIGRSGQRVAVASERAGELIPALLESAADRLAAANPAVSKEVERYVQGISATADDKPRRVRLLPLPSIGHAHADGQIRRVLLEVPMSCPLRFDDVAWAFDGSAATDRDGVLLGDCLTRATDEGMLDRYVSASRLWETRIPCALPGYERGRGRFDLPEQATGAEREAVHGRAIAAVTTALRHADILAPVQHIEVRSEPFLRRGGAAHHFAARTRFPARSMWHVRLTFERAVRGPICLGSGRFTGLGILAGVEEQAGMLAFDIVAGLESGADAESIASAFRRALMARVRDSLSSANGRPVPLPGYFTGHAESGEPLRSGEHRHLVVLADLPRHRVIAIAPHVLLRRAPLPDEIRHLQILRRAMKDLAELRAGASGRLQLRAASVHLHTDPLFAPSQHWESLTPYQAGRHPRRQSVEDAVVRDVERELHRMGHPEGRVDIVEMLGRKGKPAARVRIEYANARTGPLLLGQTLHKGGGVFCAASTVGKRSAV